MQGDDKTTAPDLREVASSFNAMASSDGALRIIVMGTGGVGKSAITGRYVSGAWNAKYDPTIEELKTKLIKHNGKALQLEILDTAGQEQYSQLREQFITTAHGFLLVFSIVDDQTLEDLKKIVSLIRTSNPNKEIPLVLVGNKSDLSSERAVGEDEAAVFANSIKAASYIEVSAKNNDKVGTAFESLIAQVLASTPQLGFGGGAGSVLGAGVNSSGSKLPTPPEPENSASNNGSSGTAAMTTITVAKEAAAPSAPAAAVSPSAVRIHEHGNHHKDVPCCVIA